MNWQKAAAAVRRPLRDAFDRSFWVVAALAVASGIGCWYQGGSEALSTSLDATVGLVVLILPKMILALFLAALIKLLVPFRVVAGLVGEESGPRGLFVATGAGALTPGGPVTSFPLVRALKDAGAGTRPLIAYVTSWSVLGLQRTLVYEVNLMGLEFAIIRCLASLPLPLIAALTSRLVPVEPEDPARGEPERR